MYKLKFMNEYEFMKIFGCLEVLLALHQGTNTSSMHLLVCMAVARKGRQMKDFGSWRGHRV